MAVAKLFKVGGSQALRLPKEFRLPGDQVELRWQGDEIVITPARKPRSPEEVLSWLKSIRIEGFMGEGREQPPPQERDWSRFDD